VFPQNIWIIEVTASYAYKIDIKCTHARTALIFVKNKNPQNSKKSSRKELFFLRVFPTFTISISLAALDVVK